MTGTGAATGGSRPPSYNLPARIGRTSSSTSSLVTDGTQFVDLNGDGRLDFVEAWDSIVTNAWENTGAGWQARNNWALPVGLVNGNKQRAKTMLADVDGDGLLDVVSTAPAGALRVWTNHIRENAGCSATTCWQRLSALETLPASGWEDLDLASTDTVVDIDGDGRADLVRLKSGAFDVLREHALRLGGCSRILYLSNGRL